MQHWKIFKNLVKISLIFPEKTFKVTFSVIVRNSHGFCAIWKNIKWQNLWQKRCENFSHTRFPPSHCLAARTVAICVHAIEPHTRYASHNVMKWLLNDKKMNKESLTLLEVPRFSLEGNNFSFQAVKTLLLSLTSITRNFSTIIIEI